MIDIIDDIYKLLDYNLNVYGSLVTAFLYKSSASNKNKATLDIEGYVAFVYYMRYDEPYPKNPNISQKHLINAIWDALKLPEKKIPV